MAAGRPVIATDVGDLGRMVRESGCGLLLHDASAKAVVEAISQLEDPETRRQMGENGLRAANVKYNAAAMQGQLAQLYERLQ
jgi:glycosyltransferase involved in cell wall biosynthesis